MTQRHKVFISYHHDNDQEYRDRLEILGYTNDLMVSKSVDIGDIDPNNNTEYVRQKIRDGYIADATVIVVLVGRETWKRKHVDWEISSGLRATTNNPRCGLLGIILPTHESYGKDKYSPYTIPPRLHDNIECGFADIYHWPTNITHVQGWIHAAFERKKTINPNNSRVMFGQNRSGIRWQ